MSDLAASHLRVAQNEAAPWIPGYDSAQGLVVMFSRVNISLQEAEAKWEEVQKQSVGGLMEKLQAELN